MHILRLLGFLFLFPILLFGQNTAEKLEKQVNEAQGEEQIRLMLSLGELYASTEPERALELGLKAAFLAKRTGNPIYEGQALLLMGLSSLNAKQNENALRYYNRALGHFEKNNLYKEQIFALEGIALVYSLSRNYEMAANYLKRSLIIAQNLSDKNVQIEIHQRLGNIFLQLNSFSRAHQEFLKVKELLGDDQRLSPNELKIKANAYRQIGFIYRNLGQFEQSLDAYGKADGISQTLGDKAKEVEDKFQIAQSLYLMQKLDSSLIYFNQVLAFYQLQNDSSSMVNVLLGIGDVFYLKEQYRQAQASYTSSFNLSSKLNIVQAQVSALVNISRCFNALGDYPSSKEYLNQALKIATSNNMTTSAAEVYRYLSQISEREGRFLQALDYYKLWADLRDSIYSEESGQKLARMQILYDITQKERENEILKQNSQIQELQLVKTQYQRMVFIVLALFLFALLVLFGFFYKAKQKEFTKQKETEQRIIEMNKNLEKRMILEIKKQEKQQLLLAQKSKLESLGTLSAGIAHEINQPLGGLSMGLDNILLRLAENNLTNDYLKEKVNLMFESVDRIKRIIEHTRTFSRSHKPASFERVDLNEVVNSTLNMVNAQFLSHGVNIEINLQSDIEKVIADKFKIEQVVLNLLSNAKFAVDEKENLQLQANYTKNIKITTSQDHEYVTISVRDNGIGIKSKDIDKIFDPFYTTKKVDKGTGLGLSISYGFIKDILGEISVDSKEGEYTKFYVKIPKS
jgi:signal transduction histidine kinase